MRHSRVHENIMSKISKKRQAEIRDAVLKKFQGDKTWIWNDTISKEWYSDIDKNVYHIENALKHLIGEDYIKSDNGGRDDRSSTKLKLSNKGWSFLSEINRVGYVVQFKKNRNKMIWSILTGIIVIATFCLTIRQDFFIKNIQTNSADKTPTNQDTIKNDTVIIKSNTKNQLEEKKAYIKDTSKVK